MSTEQFIVFLASEYFLLFGLFITISIVISLCCYNGEEPQDDADRRGSVAAAAPVAPAAEQVRPPAPVVKLPYFPCSQQGRRESDKLVCAICLEVFLQGDMCSEVPACRHLFHGECIAVWMKDSRSCPLCRVKIAAGSVEVSAADDMHGLVERNS